MNQELFAAISAVLMIFGTLVARWNETNKNKPWYVRLARVFDPTQVIDSTRRLGDD